MSYRGVVNPRESPFFFPRQISPPERRLNQSVRIGGYTPAATDANLTQFVRILSPSNRLRLAAAFSADTIDVNPSTSSTLFSLGTWSCIARTVDRTSGKELLLDQLFVNRTIPGSWEISSASEILDFQMTLTGANTGTLGINGIGNFVFTASWEPTSEIDDDEMLNLFDRCLLIRRSGGLANVDTSS